MRVPVASRTPFRAPPVRRALSRGRHCCVARIPHTEKKWKTPAAPEWDRWRFFEITFASHDFAVLQLAASLKLLARDGWYAGGSPVLAVLARADGNGGPAYPSPSPRSREGRHHGDRLAGLPTPFIQPERSSFRPGARRRSLLFGCVVLVWHRAGGGVNPRAPAGAICVTIPCRVSLC